MTLHRWIFVLVAAILLTALAVAIYFQTIQGPHWSAEQAAKQRAIDEAGLAQIEQATHHVWHEDTWIVQGVNQENEQVFVWLADGKEPQMIKAADGWSKQQMEAKFSADQPSAMITHIQPGSFDGKLVWEVFYRSDTEPKRYFYDFYSFDSGTLVDRYQLPGRTEP